MTDSDLKLNHPPIVEAVLDIDCDVLPGQDFASLQAVAQQAYVRDYPKQRSSFLAEFQIEPLSDGPARIRDTQGIQAFQYLTDDEKQIVQVRPQGFSFNRLAPYTHLDAYMPEIERTFRLFRELASPVQVRAVRLRYINRISLPLVNGKLDMEEYLTIGPRNPDGARMASAGFLIQQTLIEADTKIYVNVVLTNQPVEKDDLPIILDIQASTDVRLEADDWTGIVQHVMALRHLKNHVFWKALTEKCLRLFH